MNADDLFTAALCLRPISRPNHAQSNRFVLPWYDALMAVLSRLSLESIDAGVPSSPLLLLELPQPLNVGAGHSLGPGGGGCGGGQRDCVAEKVGHIEPHRCRVVQLNESHGELFVECNEHAHGWRRSHRWRERCDDRRCRP
jgi:hypothetical protein